MILTLFITDSNQTKNTYKLTNQSGEQYLTVIDTNVFYHGKVRRLSPNTEDTFYVYFLSKAIKKERNLHYRCLLFANVLLYENSHLPFLKRYIFRLFCEIVKI